MKKTFLTAFAALLMAIPLFSAESQQERAPHQDREERRRHRRREEERQGLHVDQPGQSIVRGCRGTDEEPLRQHGRRDAETGRG